MSGFKNTKKEEFLKKLPSTSLEGETNDLTSRSKFNFSYFDEGQAAGQKFHEWSHEQLTKLLNKLKEYSRDSLDHWQRQYIGSGKHRSQVLAVYDQFPRVSDFEHPKHVPYEAMWARFRIEWDVRLIGFIVPTSLHKKSHPKTGQLFDANTFYLVFLDANHKFYKTEK